MRFLTQIAVIWIAIVLLQLVFMKGIVLNSTTKEILETVRPDSNCTQPCWHGIAVGQTTFEQAKTSLQANYPFFTRVHVYTSAPWPYLSTGTPYAQTSIEIIGSSAQGGINIVHEIILAARNRTSALTIESAISLFGEPKWIELVKCGGEVSVVVATIGFEKGVVVRTGMLKRFDDETWDYLNLTPQIELDYIVYRLSTESGHLPKWSGFHKWSRAQIERPTDGSCRI